MQHLPERNKKILAKKIRYYMDLHFPGKGSGIRLAEEVGIAPQMLSNWLSGRRLPTVMQLYRLSKVFDVSPLELCGIRSKNTSAREQNHIETLFSLLGQCKKILSRTDNSNIQRRKIEEIKLIICNELVEWQS